MFKPILVGAAIVLASTPGQAQSKTPRVLVVGIDGCRSDALQTAIRLGQAPSLKGLVDTGCVTWNAYAGGDMGQPSYQATISGAGWGSICCGVWRDKHQINDNNFAANNYNGLNFTRHNLRAYPHFMKRLKQARPGARTASIVSWAPINLNIADGSKANAADVFLDYRKETEPMTDTGSNYPVADRLTKEFAVAHLKEADPDVLFAHFDQVDGAGHATGFTPNSLSYMRAITAIDQHIGHILEAIRARPKFAQEDWMTIVTTDHGGTGTSHGGQSADERRIFIITQGGRAERGRVTGQFIGHAAIPATVFRHLGAPIDPAWGWETTVAGIAPWLEAAHGSGRAYLSWTFPAEGLPGLERIQLYRDGALLRDLPISQRSFVDTPPAKAVANPSYAYELRFPGSDTPPIATRVAFAPATATGDVVSQLLGRWAMDGQLTAVGSDQVFQPRREPADYAPGFAGQALALDAKHAFQLGPSSALDFSDGVDFTVAFWTRAEPWPAGETPWIAGGQAEDQGWSFSGQADGASWSWELRAAKGKVAFPVSASIVDGQWHHLAVAVDRDNAAEVFFDGVSRGRIGVDGLGGLAAGQVISLGADPAGQRSVGSRALIDDLRLWRRALTAVDIRQIAVPRGAFESWRRAHFTAAQLADANVSGDDRDPDADGLSNLREFAFGGGALLPEAHKLPTVDRDTSGRLRVSYVQRNGGRGPTGLDYTADGLTYEVEYTSDLDDPNAWRRGPDFVEEIPEAGRPDAPGYHRVTVAAKPPTAANPRAFLRVRLIFGGQ